AVERWTQSTAIDWNSCVELMAGKASIASEILEKFVQQLLEDKASLNEYYQAANYQKLYQALHRLHGACCYCGVPRLKTLVQEFETRLKEHNHHDLSKLYWDTIQEIERVLSEYQAHY